MAWLHPSNESQLTFARRMPGTIILLLLILATAWLSGGKYLLIRQLWMDEVHSWLIVTDAHQSHAMNALADGVDFNPPAWFLVTRWLTGGTEHLTEFRLRLLSLMWMLLALSGLCLLLSRHFTPSVCLTAVLLTASHPLLIHQSTEIRFYGFWCACAVWLCYVVQWRPNTAVMRWFQMVSVSGLAACTATCHYFGILSIVLIVLPLACRRTRDSNGFRLAVIGLASGAAGLVSCGHFLIGQKAALSRPTWISPTTLQDSLLFLQALFPAWQILVCAAGLAVSMPSAKRFAAGASPKGIWSSVSCMLPCCSLAGMPLMIVLIAWSLQPVLVTRYAIVGITGFAPIFATALSRCSWKVQQSLTVVSLLGLGYTIGNCADQWSRDDVERAIVIQRLMRCPEDAMIVFEDRIQWMPVLHQNPKLTQRCMLAEFEIDEMAKDSTLRVVQRDVGRRIQKWYPLYRMLPIRTLAEQPLFFVVLQPGGSATDLAYPADYVTTEVSAGLVRFERNEFTSIRSDFPVLKREKRITELRATRRAGEKNPEIF